MHLHCVIFYILVNETAVISLYTTYNESSVLIIINMFRFKKLQAEYKLRQQLYVTMP